MKLYNDRPGNDRRYSLLKTMGLLCIAVSSGRSLSHDRPVYAARRKSHFPGLVIKLESFSSQAVNDSCILLIYIRS